MQKKILVFTFLLLIPCFSFAGRRKLASRWRGVAFGIQVPFGAMPIPDQDTSKSSYKYEFEGMPELDIRFSLIPKLEMEFALPILRTVNGLTRDTHPLIMRSYNVTLNYTNISPRNYWGVKIGSGISYMQFNNYPDTLNEARTWVGMPVTVGLHRMLNELIDVHVFTNSGFMFTFPAGWYGIQLGAGLMIYLDWKYYFGK